MGRARQSQDLGEVKSGLNMATGGHSENGECGHSDEEKEI